MKEANQLLGVVRKRHILGSPIIQVTSGEGSVVMQLIPTLVWGLCCSKEKDCCARVGGVSPMTAFHGLVPPLDPVAGASATGRDGAS